MGKRKCVGKIAAAAITGAVMVQMPVQAAPIDDLNKILEAQFGNKQESLFSTEIGWKEFKENEKENGQQIQAKLVLSEEAQALMGELPEAFQGTMSLDTNFQLDPVQKKWLVGLSAGVNDSSIGNLNLYADQDMLSLEVPQLLSYPAGIKSGSFSEQYEGSIWEENMGPLDIPFDITLDFFPDGSNLEETFSFVKDLEKIYTERIQTISDSVTVEVREDSKLTDTVLYDVVCDTETIVREYGDMIADTMEVMEQVPGVQVSDIEQFKKELETAVIESKAILGDQFVLRYWVEDDLVTQVTMNIDAKKSWENLDAADEHDDDHEDKDEHEVSDPNERIGSVDISFVLRNPKQPEAGFDMLMNLESFEDRETASASISFVNEITDTTIDTSIKVDVKEDSDKEFSNEIYKGSYDAETGKWSCQMLMKEDADDVEQGMKFEGSVSDIEKGKSFTLNLDKASLCISGFEMPVCSGSLVMTSEAGTIDTPQNTVFLGDITESDLMSMASEIAINAQNWAADMGLLSENQEPDTVQE